MTRGSIARRYARALLMLAKDIGKVEEFSTQLQSFADLLATNTQLFNSLRNPAHPPNERKAVLSKIIERMGLDPLMRNFILLVNDRRRIEHLPNMALSYRELSDNLANRMRAQITTAKDMKEEHKKTVSETLAHKIGKQIVITHKLDPKIIGGIIAQVGNLLFDYSLRNELHKVEQELIGK